MFIVFEVNTDLTPYEGSQDDTLIGIFTTKQLAETTVRYILYYRKAEMPEETAYNKSESRYYTRKDKWYEDYFTIIDTPVDEVVGYDLSYSQE